MIIYIKLGHILVKLKQMKGHLQGLYMLDKELGSKTLEPIE